MGLRTARIIVVATVGLLAGCGRSGPQGTAVQQAADSAPAVARRPAAQAQPTIVFLGTSLTAGFGLDPDSAFTTLIQQKLDSAGLRYTVINAGVSGESSAGALRRIDWVLRQPPALLVLETGANDGLRGQTPDSVRANIQAMIDRVRAASPSTRIVLAGMEAMPNLGADYVRRFRAIFPSLARDNHLPLIPFLLQNVAGVDSLNQQDGIHPNPAGSRIVADNVWRVLARELAS
jgi:acyl-CoA thioesterase-1